MKTELFSKVVVGDIGGSTERITGTWGLLASNGRWYKLCTNTESPYFLPITPDQIETMHGSVGYFGRSECETFAWRLVKLAQARQGWREPFTLADLDAVSSCPWNQDNLTFFVELGWLTQNGEKQYTFTAGFVLEVFAKNAKR